MGISGLLPLLKDIQVNKPLSAFAGQTIAVDAYVWLHKGTYGCAPDIATGKKTTKYVDYAMHRVRLLQHYHIQPYIVFDGGPLPAKKGTESDRKKRRDENLTRANILAAQGKHSQAREYYVKCVDVTPQMAYQFIKALRAESVPYVVAPYEADAQLAYLERIGVVDGILTEDSDLLVFGCKSVLLKLDPVSSTVTCISRADFASVASGGVSLVGWSDVQFRSMAILSGCDYLPSVPGIGLKTAWSLLRKYKTVENVVRALCLEGKKKVPEGYMQAFRLAEKVFLHQRVYDPTQKILVHLTDPPCDGEWDEEAEAYVGASLEPALAKRIAEGDACPISLLPMEDINPAFVPRTLKAIPTNSQTLSRSNKNKGKGKSTDSEKPASGILGFFTPKAKVGTQAKGHPQTSAEAAQRPAMPNIGAGRSSGKRTLAEVMDQDIAAKRKKQGERDRKAQPISSKFFCATSSSPPSDSQDRSCEELYFAAGPSRIPANQNNKENVPYADEEEDILMEEVDPVTQEDGYISPSLSMDRWDTPELSSPVRSRGCANWDSVEADDFGADVLSSPPVTKPLPGLLSRVASSTRKAGAGNGVGRGLVRKSPPQWQDNEDTGEQQDGLGPDLRDTLGEWDWDEVTSDIECPEVSEESACSATPSPGPVTPEDSREYGGGGAVICDEAVDSEEIEEVVESQAIAARNAKVANGWWERWRCDGMKAPGSNWKQTTLKRRETTMTPDGRQRPLQPRPHSALPSYKRKSQQQDLRSAGRRSLVFTENVKAAPKSDLRDTNPARAGRGD